MRAAALGNELSYSDNLPILRVSSTAPGSHRGMEWRPVKVLSAAAIEEIVASGTTNHWIPWTEIERVEVRAVKLDLLLKDGSRRVFMRPPVDTVGALPERPADVLGERVVLR